MLRLGLFDESLLSWQDIDLHVRAITVGFRYLRFPEVDHHVRWQFEPTKVSVEQRRSPRHLEAAMNILEKFEHLIREGPGMNWVRQRALCSLYFFVAQQWEATGSLSDCLAVLETIRQRPARLTCTVPFGRCSFGDVRRWVFRAAVSAVALSINGKAGCG